ncbi:hypothetical protein Tco_1250467 [Tanacetum coccineum]
MSLIAYADVGFMQDVNIHEEVVGKCLSSWRIDLVSWSSKKTTSTTISTTEADKIRHVRMLCSNPLDTIPALKTTDLTSINSSFCDNKKCYCSVL